MINCWPAPCPRIRGASFSSSSPTSPILSRLGSWLSAWPWVDLTSKNNDHLATCLREIGWPRARQPWPRSAVPRARGLRIRPSDRRAVRPSDSRVPLPARSEEHTSELQSPCRLVCRLLLEKKKKKKISLILNKTKN